MIKVIIFDLGNVVVKFDTHLSAGKIAELSGSDEQDVFDLFFDSDLADGHHNGSISGSQLYETVMARFNLTLSFEEFRLIWERIFWENEDVVEIIKKLRPYYRIFLMSNIGDLHWDYIHRTFSSMRLFDEHILSYKVGANKPEERIYQEAITRAGCVASEIIFIDDRPELIEAACLYGIRGIVYTDTPSLKKQLAELITVPKL